MRPDLPRPACPLCGTLERRALLAKEGYSVVRCRRCGLVYVDADLNASELQVRYDADYYCGGVFHDYVEERDIRISSARDHCALLAKIVPAGRLLDVGCATGFFLEAASAWWNVSGVELSEFAADYARREFGYPVLTGDISSVELPANSFDIVTLWNTIEHVADPREAMAHVARVAVPGGLVVLTTGNVSGPLARRNLAEWELMTPPEHLYFFDPRTIMRLLDDAGFDVRRVVHDGIVANDGPLRSSQARTLASAVGLGNVMTVYARRSAGAARRRSARRGLGWRLRPVGRV